MKKFTNRLYDLSVIARDIEGIKNARLVAAIYDGSRLISLGMNSRKTHPVQLQYAKNPLAIHFHAEIQALTRAKNQLRTDDFTGLDLYIARVSFDNYRKNWWWSLAFPCVGCTKAIQDKNINRIIYTIEPNKFEILRKNNDRMYISRSTR